MYLLFSESWKIVPHPIEIHIVGENGVRVVGSFMCLWIASLTVEGTGYGEMTGTAE